MLARDTHRVRRLRWQARAGAPAQAFALRTLLRERQDDVQALLDRVFDSATPTGAIVRLPRLELQLHARDLNELGQALLPRLEAALQEALADLWPQGAEHTAEGPNEGGWAPATARQIGEQASGREALRHYLASGALPWTLAGLSPETARQALDLAATAALEDVLAHGLPLADLLPVAWADRVGALGRWLALLPATQRQRWLQASPAPALALENASWVAHWFAWMSDDSPARIDAQALWLAWHASTAAAPAPAVARALRDALDKRVAAAAAAAVSAPGAAAGAGDASSWPAAILQPLRRWLDGCIEAPAAPASATAPASAADTQRLRPDQPVRPTAPTADDTALLVPLAGLVLLHPYLPRLLRGCGIVQEGAREIDDAQLPRACALLHALACGEAPAAEFSLPLVKLLLGRSPEEPLHLALPALADADREELNALLDAVRQHWTALRGTGVEGLRVSFLQRRGLLRPRDGAWLLQMQTEAFDMLISLLPWSLGFVKLPWMAQPLMVEWPTP